MNDRDDVCMKSPGSTCLRECIKVASLVSFFLALCARAHEPSKSYLSLTLNSSRFTCQWDIPLRDLRSVMPPGLDKPNFTGREQIKAHYRQMAAYAFSHLQISLDGNAAAPRLAGTDPVVEELSDGEYLRLDFLLENVSRPKTLQLSYKLFFETNSLHRGLVRIEADGKIQIAAFSPGHPTQEFQLVSPVAGGQFFAFLREGVWHIWTGYDHILFLLALLLPSVLQREAGQWRGVGAFGPACLNVLKIVTAFTGAHSLTLSLATLGIVKLPSRLTESAIAVSVALAAGNNLWPLVRERGWIVAFGFGLIHGFGFATALSDLGLVHGGLLAPLIGFNLGVEIGQLAIVAVFLPAAFALRRTWFYQDPLLRLGSALILVVATAWCAERALDVKFMPF
jgi:HupE/UreJ protein